MMAAAGADGLELNLYHIATDPRRSAAELESDALILVQEIRDQVKIPLAVKLSPFYTSLPNFVQQLQAAGADAVVLFNRFYEPDIDVDNLVLERNLHLSDPTELPLRLRWLAVLSDHTDLDLSCSGGVHGPQGGPEGGDGGRPFGSGGFDPCSATAPGT